MQKKLVWLTVFRTVATLSVLAMVALRLGARPTGEELSREDTLSFVVIGAIFFLNLSYGLLLRLGWGGRGAAQVQILGDVVIASSLVYLTGGAESPLAFTYSLAVVGAAILLQGKGAFGAACASSAAFAALSLCIQHNYLRSPSGSVTLPEGRLAFAVASNVLAQFLTAALAGYLSRQLFRTGATLSAREEDLRKLDRLQRQILTSMPSGLLTCEVDGRVTFINRAGAQILGLEPAQVEQRHVEELMPGVLRWGAEGKRRELLAESPAGRRVLGLTATSLDSDTRSILIVFQDLTDLRRMQTALERVDRLAALGTLSAQLAHEIRNPLAAMRGSAQMLASEVGSSPSTARLSNILVRESDRLERLVEEFLRFARPTSPSRRPVAFAELVRETLSMVQADPIASSARIEAKLEELDAEVDPDQVKQVLLNLLRNALQAAGPHGAVRLGLTSGEGTVVLTVWDSAGSIPTADLSRIFEPFFTTRAGGTGLGLSTAHAIIQAHGGSIDVTSSPETGTEFRVGLPTKPLEAVLARLGG